MIKKYLPALAFSLALLLFLLLLLAAVPAFYIGLQKLSGVPENTGFSQEFLRHADVSMRDYLFGISDHLLIDDQGKSLFGAQEVFHMAEVRHVFEMLFKACLFFAVAAGLLYSLLKTRILHDQLYTSLGLLVFLGIGSLFFQQAFTLMHQVFFNNDLWLFPQESMLITLLPEKFFLLFTLCLLGLFLGGSALIYVVERKVYDSSSR